MAKSNKFTVVSEQNDHDHAAVRAHPRNETYHIVDYADGTARDRVADLPAGSVVRMELSRAGRRSNVWCAESVHVAETDGGVDVAEVES
ncbi:hypothetical protein [Halorubrum sp. F4]|uniref:hypothetical protein n=1 Tax=Halorubrum sp. F4 TaxID=2989715 RepID=UPI0024816CBA|nr:hypothetical protein [Halorubrum sp. F4]